MVSLDVTEEHEVQPDAVVVGDVADPDAHRRAASAGEELGDLRGWVNCAGFNILGAVDLLDEQTLRRGLDVDLIGVFFGTAEAVRRMRAASRGEGERGSIVNVSSIHAAVGSPGFAAYAMAKGGIEALTRQVAAEYVANGIRCNAIAPGLIESPMNDRLLAEAADPDALRRTWARLTPMGRWGRPSDVAAGVAFLLSQDAAFITGETLAVNGGATVLSRGV